MEKKIHVLYVDDEPSLLEIGKLFLEQDRLLRVDTENDPANVLCILNERTYDVIVSDYQMPGINGLDLLQSVRKNYPDLPFIIFTGRGREEVVISALNYGVTSYIQKGGEPTAQFAELAHRVKFAVQKRRAELDLAKSELRYRQVVESQTEFITQFTPDGRVVFANEAYLRYFSLDRKTCVGSKFHPVIYVKDIRAVKDHFAALTQEHPSGTILHRILLPDGTIRWHQWTDTALFNEQGKLTGYQSVGRDVTDLRQAEDLWRTIIDNSGSATIIAEQDEVISYANPAVADLVGIPVREITGKKWREFIDPSDLPTMQDYHMLRRINTSFAPVRYQFTVVRKDRKPVRVISTIAVIPDTRKTVASLIDITNILEMEDAMEKRENVYRSIIERMQDGYVRTDPDGIVIMITPSFEARLGYGPGELVGKDLHSIYADPADHATLLTELKKSGRVSRYRACLKKKNGDPVFVTISNQYLTDARGRVLGVEGVIRDITHIVMLERNLARKNRMLATVAESARCFLDRSSPEDTIRSLISTLGSATGVSRVFVYSFDRSDPARPVMNLEYESYPDGTHPGTGTNACRDIPFREYGYSRFEADLLSGNAIFGNVAGLLPEEQGWLKDHGIVSLAIVPIRIGDACRGFVGFVDKKNERDWSGGEVEILFLAARMIGFCFREQEDLPAGRNSVRRSHTKGIAGIRVPRRSRAA